SRTLTIKGAMPMADILPLRICPVEPLADPTGAPLVADARRLAVLLDVGLRTVRTWDAAGKLPEPVRIGGRVVWRLDELRAWLDAGAPDRKTWAAIRAARK
ncbi:MAG: helix-turn-helix domain-containing protein, partial [Gemmataceae bacterium]|nr:helix-turn-helix domain-containing protein [Gemmataceae bacterium]